MATKTPIPAAKGKPRRRRTSTTAVLAIMHAALVGIVAVYAATHSIPVVLIAAATAVLLVGVAVIRGLAVCVTSAGRDPEIPRGNRGWDPSR